MKKKLIIIMIPVGLLLSSSTFVFRHFMPISDFTDGFLKGFGIGLMILSLVFQRKWKQAGK